MYKARASDGSHKTSNAEYQSSEKIFIRKHIKYIYTAVHNVFLHLLISNCHILVIPHIFPFSFSNFFIYSLSSNSSWSATFLFAFWLPLQKLFWVQCSSILCTCPNQTSFLSVILSIIECLIFIISLILIFVILSLLNLPAALLQQSRSVVLSISVASSLSFRDHIHIHM